MIEPGEQAQINRLERRVCQLERDNWRRADLRFRLTIYGLTAVIVTLAIVWIALGNSHPGH